MTAQIQEMFPSLLQLSQYSIKSGEFSKIYKRLMTMLIGGTLLLAIILGVIVTFLNKGYIHSRNKELAILYSLGYSKKNTAFRPLIGKFDSVRYRCGGSLCNFRVDLSLLPPIFTKLCLLHQYVFFGKRPVLLIAFACDNE